MTKLQTHILFVFDIRIKQQQRMFFQKFCILFIPL